MTQFSDCIANNREVSNKEFFLLSSSQKNILPLIKEQAHKHAFQKYKQNIEYYTKESKIEVKISPKVNKLLFAYRIGEQYLVGYTIIYKRLAGSNTYNIALMIHSLGIIYKDDMIASVGISPNKVCDYAYYLNKCNYFNNTTPDYDAIFHFLKQKLDDKVVIAYDSKYITNVNYVEHNEYHYLQFFYKKFNEKFLNHWSTFFYNVNNNCYSLSPDIILSKLFIGETNVFYQD